MVYTKNDVGAETVNLVKVEEGEVFGNTHKTKERGEPYWAGAMCESTGNWSRSVLNSMILQYSFSAQLHDTAVLGKKIHTRRY